MKYILSFFLLYLTFFATAQTKRFYYGVTFNMSSDSIRREQNDVVVLDINKNENFFYSNEYLITDSINNISNKFKFAYPKFKSIVKYNTFNNHHTFMNNLSMNYYEYDDHITLNWNLKEETKKIGKYIVQKAETNYGGRAWTAWFTNEIPLSYGPYVFNGLPGLILEIYDNNNDYHFTFIQNKNSPSFIDSQKLIDKYIGIRKFKIEKEKWKVIQLNFYNNPIAEYKKGEAKRVKDNGMDYTPNDYRDWEKSIQNNLNKNNNPIELSERVIFH